MLVFVTMYNTMHGWRDVAILIYFSQTREVLSANRCELFFLYLAAVGEVFNADLLFFATKESGALRWGVWRETPMGLARLLRGV